MIVDALTIGIPSFDLTYEGLKFQSFFYKKTVDKRFDLTYEGLKFFVLHLPFFKFPHRFDLTYEGLKCGIGSMASAVWRKVLILPMRD